MMSRSIHRFVTSRIGKKGGVYQDGASTVRGGMRDGDWMSLVEGMAGVGWRGGSSSWEESGGLSRETWRMAVGVGRGVGGG